MTELLLLVLLAAPPAPAVLWGKVTDAVDGRPVPAARLRVVGLDNTAIADANGEYRVLVPGDDAWRVLVEAPGYVPGELANQRPGGPPGQARLYPERLWLAPGSPPAFGLGPGTGLGPEPRGPVSLQGLLRASVPAQLPATIRVARYFNTSCTGSIQRIDEIDFQDYVRGVVNAEVGVFRGVAGGPAAAAECWKAFAVAARSYALHFILTQPYDGYDIKDGACNQVYNDNRDADVSAAADATAGMILVKKADPDVIDRYFYAASCAEHGTEPGYATGTIIPDATPVRACVGSWCGHDNCAGHADNPEVPGSDRCLVWGTCQWGSVERSMNGETFRDILGHYQPNCAIREMGAPQKGTLKGVVYRAPDLQDRIAGAEVTLSGGPTVVYDGVTPWSFELDPGTYTVTARAEGFLPGSVERTVQAGVTIWGSIGLSPVEDDGGDGDDGGSEERGDASIDGGDPESDGGDSPADGDDGGRPKSGGCGCDVATENTRSECWGAVFLLAGIVFRVNRRVRRIEHRASTPV
ncbi:MAG: hypothetical protein GYA21_01625 [Myxococcales bacterium]|nr:hypothetical protein [Myxococcales bacterium]